MLRCRSVYAMQSISVKVKKSNAPPAPVLALLRFLCNGGSQSASTQLSSGRTTGHFVSPCVILYSPFGLTNFIDIIDTNDDCFQVVLHFLYRLYPLQNFQLILVCQFKIFTWSIT